MNPRFGITVGGKITRKALTGEHREHGGGRSYHRSSDWRLGQRPARAADRDFGGGLPLLRRRRDHGLGAQSGAPNRGPRLRWARRGHGLDDVAALYIGSLAGRHPRRSRQHEWLPHHRGAVSVLSHQFGPHKGKESVHHSK